MATPTTTPGGPRPVDLALIVLAVAAVSTSAPLIREAAAPALAIGFWRNGLASAALVPWVAATQRAELRATSRAGVRTSALAGLLLAAHFATWIPSLSYTTVAASVALVASQPVWAAAIARARGEHVPAAVWAGVALGVAGVVAIVGVDVRVSTRALAGDLLALTGGALAAAYVTVGAAVRRTTATSVYTAVCYPVAAAVLLVVCLVGRQPLTGYAGSTWLALLALTIGPQLLGHSVFNHVLRTTSPTLVSTAILFEVVGAALLAYAWFGERPPAGTVPAAALLAAGVVIVIRAGARQVAVAPTD